MARDALSLSEARRIALAAQGFDRPRPSGGVDKRHLRRTIRQLGLLQIDSVNVLLPAHYQVPFSRLGPYELSDLDDLIYRRREFTEQWAHEASILPVESWPLLRHRTEMRDRRMQALASFMERHADYVGWVLEEVRARGPLTAGDLPEPDGTRGRAREWWGWTIAKAALEGHFARGTLAVAHRRTAGFARAYDLAERVFSPEHQDREVRREDAQRELMRLASRALGVGTASDLADYYRMPIREARSSLADLAAAGELRTVWVEGWREPAYLHPAARLPRRIDASALLSPFDPVVWYRPRAARLFDFNYRIEIYVPRAKRRWGYYVLPILYGDRIVGRIDPLFDRNAGVLRINALHWEPGAPKKVPLQRAVRGLSRWVGAREIEWMRDASVPRRR